MPGINQHSAFSVHELSADALEQLFAEQVERGVALAPFTTFKVGGPAALFVRVKDVEHLSRVLGIAHEHSIPVYVLGGGSDVLVHDNGFNGLVIKIEIADLEIDENGIAVIGAGMPLSAAIMRTTRAGWQGLEFAVGVPASVGGAVWANLGCRGSDISETLQSVTIIDDRGVLRELSKQECEFGYRDSIFKTQIEAGKPWIAVRATFQLTAADPADLRDTVMGLTKQKKAEQNVGDRTAGCAFRNPADSEKAASQLIDELGLKGYAIGGAQVSTKHANFIVNTGDATADQIVQLISYVKQQVRDKAGVQLMEEIEYVGFPAGGGSAFGG